MVQCYISAPSCDGADVFLSSNHQSNIVFDRFVGDDCFYVTDCFYGLPVFMHLGSYILHLSSIHIDI